MPFSFKIERASSETKRHRTEQQMISIPALPDRDFRAIHLAKKQKRTQKELYKPEPINSMGGPSKKHSSVVDAEGLDKMNSKTIEGGLQPPPTVKTVPKIERLALESESAESVESETVVPVTPAQPLTIEERAVKELLSQANSGSTQQVKIEAIPMRNEGPLDTGPEEEGGDDSGDSGDETAQFRKDVSKRPDCSTLEDYERIPVGQFGLALLKGMGWKEGTAATKRGRVGLVEAYVPQARPSLLGIGAKPLVLDSDPSDNSKKSKPAKPERKYVPLLRKVVDHGGKPRSRSRSPSNRGKARLRSRSPPDARSSSTHSSHSSNRTSRRERELYDRPPSDSSRKRSTHRERDSSRYRDHL
ncbi:hypothetical protein PTTG_03722 [Puccinia triticina 1-1 BBBD Race 1]|uniref:G-patch_2 domain-containing protein n=1 Tax=Puccinia triticina (isolate 1-1 / race 1 (BBBD)) TaxID=630390 RepID=A0A180GHG9_PUCT1|nr:hypothetical protein PTTG_03722 [Puccinia triticina 1-1 BBBD Race 1]